MGTRPFLSELIEQVRNIAIHTPEFGQKNRAILFEAADALEAVYDGSVRYEPVRRIVKESGIS